MCDKNCEAKTVDSSGLTNPRLSDLRLGHALSCVVTAVMADPELTEDQGMELMEEVANAFLQARQLIRYGADVDVLRPAAIGLALGDMGDEVLCHVLSQCFTRREINPNWKYCVELAAKMYRFGCEVAGREVCVPASSLTGSAA